MLDDISFLPPRLLAKISIDNTPDACWLWIGAHDQKGYGQASYQGKRIRITRLILGLTDPGVLACHHCDNPPCCRPSHLFAGTHSMNMQDAAAKGRIATIGRSLHTHCKHGHEYTPENTRWRMSHGSLYRLCRICAKRVRPVNRMALAEGMGQ
jgi:hypothetical protein